MTVSHIIATADLQRIARPPCALTSGHAQNELLSLTFAPNEPLIFHSEATNAERRKRAEKEREDDKNREIEV